MKETSILIRYYIMASVNDEKAIFTVAGSGSILPSIDEINISKISTTTINVTDVVYTGTLNGVTATGLVGQDTLQTFKNKSLDDSTTFVVGSADTTKKIAFIANSSTGVTTTLRTNTQTVSKFIDFPDANDVLIGRTTTDTLSNKTLTKPQIASLTTDGAATITFPAGMAGTVTLLDLSQTMKNKELITPVIAQLSSTGGGGLLTLPAGPDIITGRNTVDTLTNKTLQDSSTLVTSSTSGAALKFDLSAALSTLTILATNQANATISMPATTGTLALTNAPSFSGSISLTDVANQIVFGNQTTLNVPVAGGARTLTIPDVGQSTASFIMSAGTTQTISGNLTLGGTVPTIALSETGGAGSHAISALTTGGGSFLHTLPLANGIIAHTSDRMLTFGFFADIVIFATIFVRALSFAFFGGNISKMIIYVDISTGDNAIIQLYDVVNDLVLSSIAATGTGVAQFVETTTFTNLPVGNSQLQLRGKISAGTLRIKSFSLRL
jgi:hypothetical protein